MRPKHRAPDVTDSDHVLGPLDAPVTLIEYGDFQCPYCGAEYPILKRVRERLGGRLRFAFRHFPIADSHPNAEHAAEAAESVSAQRGPDGFWRMHDLMFENQRNLLDRMLVVYAGNAGADPAVVADDLQAGRWRDLVRHSFLAGAHAGVNGTPTLFIDGIRYDGPRDEDTLVAALDMVASDEEARRDT